MDPNGEIDPLRSRADTVPVPSQSNCIVVSGGQSTTRTSGSPTRPEMSFCNQEPELSAPSPIRPLGNVSQDLEEAADHIDERLHGKPRRVGPVNRSQVIIDEQIDFLSYLSSQNGDQVADVLEEEQYGEEVEEEEPKFPEQVYNVLLVGAAEVGQTSMIMYVCPQSPLTARSLSGKNFNGRLEAK